MSHLARLFSVCVSCLLSHRENVTHVATTAMQVNLEVYPLSPSLHLTPPPTPPPQSLLEEVVGPHIESMADKDMTNNSTQLQTLHKIYM